MGITITLTDQARKATIVRTGRDPGQRITVDVSTWTEADRAALLATVQTSRDGDMYTYALSPTDTTPDALIAAAHEAATKEQARRDAAQREQEERETAAREHAAAALAGPIDAWMGTNRYYADYPCPSGYHSTHYPDYRAAYDAVPGVRERRDAARTETQRRAEEKARRTDEARDLLADELARIPALERERDQARAERRTLAEFLARIPQDALRGALKAAAEERATDTLTALRDEIEGASPVTIFEDETDDETD